MDIIMRGARRNMTSKRGVLLILNATEGAHQYRALKLFESEDNVLPSYHRARRSFQTTSQNQPKPHFTTHHKLTRATFHSNTNTKEEVTRFFDSFEIFPPGHQLGTLSLPLLYIPQQKEQRDRGKSGSAALPKKMWILFSAPKMVANQTTTWQYFPFPFHAHLPFAISTPPPTNAKPNGPKPRGPTTT
ncbi:hypothetical protein EJ04DRAFT_243213 [Polyplosphaeria fusca]|uniref:Uncharacterized protein n=1 Tax=Polyplosphaeria fusca TaxID=682080 RepID=A0A9P4R008_9PLEO|nr:hypothetical protein EJ04DRAFT_243213 [Polyplosphaeria fusca]